MFATGSIDVFTDVTIAFALKKQAGVTILNVGCLYQHDPQKYQRLHAKGEDWVHWPLTTTPASFHKFKDADELRSFFSCALYDAQGKPRPAPRSFFGLYSNGCNASAGAAVMTVTTSLGAAAANGASGGAVVRAGGLLRIMPARNRQN